VSTLGLAAPERGPREPQRARKQLRIRLTQLDGELPNLALMKLSAYHKARGDEVVFTRNAPRDMYEGEYDRVYGSTIFTRSRPLIERLKRDFPDAIVGGTGTDSRITVEDAIGLPNFDLVDYSIYPTRPVKGKARRKRIAVPETRSLGWTMRGCRFRCGHCVVPAKEGRPKATGTIHDIWRKEPYPKEIVLLDNDFFGVEPELWRARIDEIRTGGFKVSFNQGINVRVISEEQARAIASVRYYNNTFTRKTLYTAFDSIADERVFRRGIERLIDAGVRGRQIVSYMLVGYDENETWERIFRRLDVMLEYGIRPYPMPYQQFDGSGPPNAITFGLLKEFQRYVVRRHYHRISWEKHLLQPEGRRRNAHNRTRNFFDEI
jgi:hypothetical protein